MKYTIGLIVLAFLFSSCSQDSLSDKEVATYTVKGKKIGQVTMQKLGSNLMQQMKLGGVQQAIPFCNISANPLTEEISKKHNVTIKRTSHKLRNTANKPNKAEETILKQYINSIANGEQLKPIVSKGKNGKIHFYAPIKMQKKCLACHGAISKQTDSIVKSLYPNDEAIGFNQSDLRGILSVTFN